MAPVEEQIKTIAQKLQLLVKNHQQLRKEYTALKKETEGLRIVAKERNDTIQKLEEKIDSLKMSAPALAPDEKKMLEQRINGYLSEIEKCLVLLNS